MDLDGEGSGGLGPVEVSTGRSCRLAMQELRLTGRVSALGGRLEIRHVFESAEEQALELVYPFMLPRHAALRGFRVVGSGFDVRSELRPVQEAEKDYEAGVAAGHLSTLTRQFEDGLVNLAVGQVKPGERVTVLVEMVCGVDADDEGFRFWFPFTIAPSYHAQARCVETDDGGLEMNLGWEGMEAAVPLSWQADPDRLHRVSFNLAVVAEGAITEVSSPSHPLRVRTLASDTVMASLASADALPDRDLVLEVRH